MSYIFISHSCKDNDIANVVREHLAAEGYRSLFLDFDPEIGIAAGQDWEHTLYKHLTVCRAVIVLCSSHSMTSRWCFAEIAIAKSLGKHIFPLRISPCQLDSILSDHQIVDLSAEGEAAYARLWSGLRTAGLDPKDDFGFDLARAPYPGLNVFEEADAGVYFGRDAEINEALEALLRMKRRREKRMLLIVGASGSGKSSLIRSGVLPRLRKDTEGWMLTAPLRPSDRRTPLEGLACLLDTTGRACGLRLQWREILNRLHSVGSSPSGTKSLPDPLGELALEFVMAAGRRDAALLIVIDQLEELFSAVSSSEASAFLRLMRRALEAKGTPLLVVATLRSDYLEVFQNHLDMRGFTFDNLTLGSMPQQNFGQIILGPAKRVGIAFESGLVEKMVLDTQTDDALPLLAFTLREMYERCRDRSQFTVKSYQEEIGGIRGAIGKVVDRTKAEKGWSAHLSADLRRSFMKMVQVDEEGRFVRRAAKWAEIPVGALPILEKLIDARLLVSSGDAKDRTVEVAHEALFRVWPELASWLDENREFLLWRNRLRNDVEDWERAGRSAFHLLHDARLSEAEKWALEVPDELTPSEASLIHASANREKLRRLWTRLTAGTIVTLIFGALIYWLWSEQQKQRDRALAQIDVLERAGSEAVPDIIESLKPFSDWVVPDLRERISKAELLETKRRFQLALHALDVPEPQVLIARLLEAESGEFLLLRESLLRLDRNVCVRLLEEELRNIAKPRKGSAARRQAIAAVLLAQFGRAQDSWPLLSHEVDPTRRSHMIHLLGRMLTNPLLIVERLEGESEVSARRALILSLAEFRADQFKEDDRRRLSDLLLKWYREDPDPGVHSAVEWLMGHNLQGRDARKCDWRHRDALAQIDQQLASKPRREQRWYVTSQGHTLAVIPGPVEFTMGFPDQSPRIAKPATPHRRRIPRSFAIGTKEVTKGQFELFLQAHPEIKNRRILGEALMQASPDPSGPVIAVSWYEAAQYCNWMSGQEGIPREQWCYPERVGMAEETELPNYYLKRTGYRLPTEAEWEYACRAGSETNRFYGDSESLLKEYSWYTKSSNDERTWHVGQLKPNDLGLFDTYGNVMEWCQDRVLDYPVTREQAVVLDEEDTERRVSAKDKRSTRGGAYYMNAVHVQSANRSEYDPSFGGGGVGLRIARTMP